MFIKAVFKTTFGLSDVLKITFSALNHVHTYITLFSKAGQEEKSNFTADVDLL